MTTQAKRLRKLMKDHGLTQDDGTPPRVRTQRTRSGEWGRARAVCRRLSSDEIAALKLAEPYIEIVTVPCGKYTFSVLYT